MRIRSVPLVAASLAVLAFAAAPVAGGAPASSSQLPQECVTDVADPSSGITIKAAQRARKTHVLRGTARDGCGVDEVRVSIVRRAGSRCRHLGVKGRLGHRITCLARRWLPTRELRDGTANDRTTVAWSMRMPERLPRGHYVLRTRAVDLAGNVQHPWARRFTVR